MYIPPGTYKVSETINMNTDTILMGDATDVRVCLPLNVWLVTHT